MNITWVMVMTLDGRVTKGRQSAIYSWTSKEDSKYFSDLLKRHNFIVMGSGTYDANRSKIKPVENTLRVVVTHHPEQYANEQVSGKLEFIDISPKQLIKNYSQQYSKMLLVSGPALGTSFLKKQMIDELYITIEPKLFGEGKKLITEKMDVDLHLESFEKLNEKGTILLKYKVVK